MNILHASAACLLLGLAATPPARAYTILPPTATVAGHSILDWTKAWWTWALQSPAANNPIADPTGAAANVNNDGPVFFVAATDGVSGPAARAFSAPADRPLLVPLINFADIEAAEVDPPGATLAQREAAAAATVAGWVAATVPGSLFASIDGVPVANPQSYLEVTGVFSSGPVQPGSYAEALGVPTGAELSPMEAAGYYLMIEGLAPGPHTLSFGGATSGFTVAPNCCTPAIGAFASAVTDTIEVPEPATALLLPGALLLARPGRRSRRKTDA